MKFRNIYITCRDNYKAIENLNANRRITNSREVFTVSGWKNALKALMNTKDIEALREESNEVINAIPELFVTHDKFDLKESEWIKVSSAQGTLLRTMNDIMRLYEKMGMNTENKIGIDIKLPRYNDFGEFVSYLNSLEFIFTKCPFLQAKDEKLEFENVDIGSTWLTFLVTGTVLTTGSILLNNIAAFIDKCIILRSHYLATKKQKQDLEKEEKDIKEKEIILEYIDNLYKKEVDAAIQELEEVTKYKLENKDGDERGRTEQCFEKMGKLIDKGLQIYSTIDAPDETKQLFKPLEMQYLGIMDKIKLLEKKENKQDE